MPEYLPGDPPSRSQRSLCRFAFSLVGLALVAGLSSTPARAQTADFRVLDNIQGGWINLNHVPIRPMAFDNAFGDLWAVNTHDSTVVHYAGLSAQPDATYPVPWSPVSIALWTDPSAAAEPERLVVVCRGTYGLAVLKRSTGETLAFIPLPAEPGDIAIVGSNAWVTCSGADRVVRVDLIAEAINLTVPIQSEHPLFLTVDGNDILVTPQFSGNNTVVDKNDDPRARTANRRGILDLTDPNVAVSTLPDEDVIRISPSGVITQTISGVGTILFGHAINPVTGELWVLNNEANNLGTLDTNHPAGTLDHLLLQSEPSIRGMNVRNRITRVDLTAGTTSTIELELDQTGAYDDARTIGQPYAIDFVPVGQPGAGNAYVVGLLTNRVAVYDASGNFVEVHDILPSGSIPRAVHLDAANHRLYVYCWGNNEIQVFTLGTPVTTDVVMDLGFDPAPADVQDGRRLFYDGSHSRHGDESCATCHVEGRMDQLAWDLSDRPADDKGPLVTQTLSGIERMRPFHWRGEQMQGLIDFNSAFDALLGGAPLDVANRDFDKFEQFVFSIQSPANPVMDPSRIVNNAFSPALPAVLPPNFTAVPGDAVNGQNLWFDVPTVGSKTCNDCHSLPTATNADVIADGGSNLHPKRSRLMVTAFNAMWRKSQEPLLVTLHEVDASGMQTGNLTTRRYPTLGHGFAHSGASTNLIEFTRAAGGITDQEVVDIAAFMEMLDTGLAPAIHDGILLDNAHQSALQHITNYLIPEAEAGNCDLVVLGTSDFGQQVAVRWLYDPVAQVFRSEFKPLTRTLAFFQAQAQSGRGSNLFVGVPKGMGERFAVDYDSDGLFNISETRGQNTNPLVKDTDLDSFEDGHEVDNGSSPTDILDTPTDTVFPVVSNLTIQWINARNVKLNFETSEPTTYAIDLSSALHTVPTVTGAAQWTSTHNAVVSGLLPSTLPEPPGPTHKYTGTLTVRDRAGNATVVSLPPPPLTDIESLPFTRGSANSTVVLSDLEWLGPFAISVGGGGLSVKARATVNSKFLVPNSPAVPNIVLVARVLILRAGEDIPTVSTNFTSPRRFDTFTQSTGAPQAEFHEGPFVMSTASNGNGRAVFRFSQTGLASGDKVILVIDGAAEAPATFPTPPIDFSENINRWSLPDTPAIFRTLEFVFP